VYDFTKMMNGEARSDENIMIERSSSRSHNLFRHYEAKHGEMKQGRIGQMVMQLWRMAACDSFEH
jgi:hypothetical protein